MTQKIIEALATGLYLGKLPFAPGTFGTLLGVPLAWMLLGAEPLVYAGVAILFIFIAAAVADLHERYSGHHDASEIVIDEVVGYLIAAILLPRTWQTLVAAFLVFRFFDILKPYPIRQIDRRVQGGFGTVLDDVAAGMATNIVLQVVFANTTWLGVQFGADKI